MNSYDFLAGCYDELTYDVDYSAWADYVENISAAAPAGENRAGFGLRDRLSDPGAGRTGAMR